MLQEVLAGKAGPAADIVALNAGAALYAANVAPSLQAGLALAQEALASGAAQLKLDELIRITAQHPRA